MKTAIRSSIACLVSSLSWVAVAEAADSFRCGDDLVLVGDTVASVLQKCGEPTDRSADHLVYKRSEGQFTVVVYIAPDGTVGQIEERDPNL